MALDQQHIDALAAITGPKGVIEDAERSPYLTEWRCRWTGTAPIILAPASVEEVSKIAAYCHEHEIGITPQGGNTGLVGGQVPNGQILVTMKRLRGVRDVSPENNTMTVEAGLTLAEAQAEAEKADRLFPLSIGSEGTCQIGGILSTNAGGVNVIRYGNMRDLVLGIEAVLPDGTVWNGLNRLRKNNTGYDLKHLFIGGEGTLGLVTAAVLKLYPRPAQSVTVFTSLPSARAAVDLLSLMQGETGGMAASFELLSASTLELTLNQFPDLQRPVETKAPFYTLMEFTTGAGRDLGEKIETALAKAMEKDLVLDGTIAQNETQAAELWQIRHNVSEAMKKDPAYCVKCDISVPVQDIPVFLEETGKAVENAAPGARVIAFGHMGDGNIHYDILGPEDGERDTFKARSNEMERLVHDVAIAHHGSISAEHGIGILKREELAERKDPAEMQMMRAIKQALDPKNIMNPGKLL